MGVLPGWWLGKDDSRYPDPYMDTQRWAEELNRVGYTRISTVYDGYLNNNIMATLDDEYSTADKPQRVTLLTLGSEHIVKDQSTVAKIIQKVEDGLVTAGYTVDEHTLGDITSHSLPPGQDVVSVLDLAEPFFASLNETRFRQFQTLVKKVQELRCSIFWVTGACQAGDVDPRFAPVVGVARVLRTELSIDFALLEVPQKDFENTLGSVVPRLLAEFQHGRHLNTPTSNGEEKGQPDTNPETEWAHVDGRTLIARYHFVNIADQLKAKTDNQSMLARPIRKLQQHKPGLASTLYWKAVQAPALVANEVRVDVKAVGLNFKVCCYSYLNLVFQTSNLSCRTSSSPLA